MKKILTRILIFFLAISLFGCSTSKNSDDIQTVFEALDTTLNATSGVLSGTIDYSTNTKQKINYSIEIIQNGDLQIKACMGLEAEGNKIDDFLDFYIRNGKTYLNNMGTTSQSLASNIGIDTTKPISVYNPFNNFTKAELAAFFKSSKKKDNTYTLVIDHEKLATLLDGMGTLNISKANIIATVDKDHISQLTLDIAGNQAYDSTSYDVDIHLTCNVDQYNTLNEIEFPEDLENY